MNRYKNEKRNNYYNRILIHWCLAIFQNTAKKEEMAQFQKLTVPSPRNSGLNTSMTNTTNAGHLTNNESILPMEQIRTKVVQVEKVSDIFSTRGGREFMANLAN